MDSCPVSQTCLPLFCNPIPKVCISRMNLINRPRGICTCPLSHWLRLHNLFKTSDGTSQGHRVANPARKPGFFGQTLHKQFTEYLLCFDHPDGGGKAAFFTSCGFQTATWEEFAEVLRPHGRNRDVVSGYKSLPSERATLTPTRGCTTLPRKMFFRSQRV